MTSIQVAGCTPPVAYLPNAIVQVPRPVVDYARYMVDAPIVALAPVRADHVEEQSIKKSKRHRTRLQVGSTNRWRLPQSLISDLLGVSQATRAIQNSDVKPFNSSYIRVCTAEGRGRYINDDMNKEVQTSSSPLRSSMSNLTGSPKKSYLRSSLQLNRPSGEQRPPRRHPQSAPLLTRFDRSSSSMSKISSFVPERARPATTKDVFFYYSKQSREQHRAHPDVVLHCLGLDFELHSSVIKRSHVLSSMLDEVLPVEPEATSYYKSSVNKALDSLVETAGIGMDYDNGGEDNTEENNSYTSERNSRKGVNHPAHVSTVKQLAVVNINWQIDDPGIKEEAMAVALGNLYHTKYQVESHDLPQVLIAAHKLEFIELVNFCATEMIQYISYSTIASYYNSCVKTGQIDLCNTCVRWLELNLIPVMMTKIQLRDLPFNLMETVLKSSKLFTYSEYYLYICLSLWVFLRRNHRIQLMPTTTNVITYFNSLPKHSSYLETEGQMYVQLFDCLRLHGITDTAQFENIRLMNILPQESLVSLLSEHYSALQSGGDMALMRNFKKSSVRQGFIIEQDLPYHCEILSLHGFHFHLKTTKTDDTYTFYMQRLKPTDPVLSFRQCERQTFSMRPDRDVTYSITVQTYCLGTQRVYTTGVETQRFGLSGRQMRSKVLSLKDVSPPLHVTFAILFPQS